MNRPRLLAVGEAGSPTGYARAMEGLLPGLCHVFDTTLLAVNHRGAPLAGRAYEVRSNELPGDVRGFEQLPALLDELEPNLVLLHGNSDAYLTHRATLGPYRARRPDARVVVYTPVDWPEQVPAIPQSLAPVDLVVAYTERGRRTLERAFAAARLPAPPMTVIPHGVEREAFAPLARLEARRRLLDYGISVPPDAFVVLNANRNQKRKRVELTMRAFADFARERPDARLYLHMGMLDMGCDVRRVARELRIAERLITTTESDRHPHLPDEQLNLIYSACDVGVNTAAAEGFGLVSFEHATAGAAQVVPDLTACAELWEGAGMVVRPEGVAGVLGRLYDEPEWLAEVSRRCHARARAPELGWDAVARRWEEELGGVLDGLDRSRSFQR
jgi:glycosyltransferase involved in cell wall biosynthesis